MTGLPVLAEIPPLTSKQQHDDRGGGLHQPPLPHRRGLPGGAHRADLRPRRRRGRTGRGRRRRAEQRQRPGGQRQRQRTTATRPPTARRRPTRPADGQAQAAQGQVVMVTSPGPGEGKTTTVSNLAAVLAEGGLSVLVINCDFRRPRIQKYLLEKASDPRRRPTSSGSSPRPARSGPSPPRCRGSAWSPASARATSTPTRSRSWRVQKRLIAFARLHYDIVLLDTAPFLTTNDASELLADSDAVIWSVRCGKTRKRSGPPHRRAAVPARGAAARHRVHRLRRCPLGRVLLPLLPRRVADEGPGPVRVTRPHRRRRHPSPPRVPGPDPAVIARHPDGAVAGHALAACSCSAR